MGGLSKLIFMATALCATSALAESPIPTEQPKRIQVAFVLDTTGSMSGLIEGAKQKIWSIANNLKDLEPRPEIEFALLGYRDKGDDYIVKKYEMTADLQDIYGKLVAFGAGGGGDTPESVNQALREAVYEIAWSQESDVFRVAFLVGDAPPHMDYQEEQYPAIVRTARSKDIVVNAIQAGDMQATTPIWKEIARLGGGDFARIQQDGGMRMVDTPFDQKIRRKNVELNRTVIPYGSRERQSKIRSKTASAEASAPSVASDMAAYISKSARVGKVVTGSGDLTESVMSGSIALDAVPEAELSDTMKAMAPADRAAYVAGNVTKRTAIKTELESLVAQRDAWLAEQRKNQTAPADGFDLKVEKMIESQAARKGFVAK